MEIYGANWVTFAWFLIEFYSLKFLIKKKLSRVHKKVNFHHRISFNLAAFKGNFRLSLSFIKMCSFHPICLNFLSERVVWEDNTAPLLHGSIPQTSTQCNIMIVNVVHHKAGKQSPFPPQWAQKFSLFFVLCSAHFPRKPFCVSISTQSDYSSPT